MWKNNTFKPETMNTISELKSLNPSALNKLPKTANIIGGVYFLFHNEVLVYIGMSANIHQRIASHIHNAKPKTQKRYNSPKKIEFDTYSFIEVPKSKRRDYEKRLIDKYNPKYNGSKSYLRW